MADPTTKSDLLDQYASDSLQRSEGSSSHAHPSPTTDEKDITTTDEDDDDDPSSDTEADYDGHRPTPLEIRLSRTRTANTARSASTVTTVTSHDSSITGGRGVGAADGPDPGRGRPSSTTSGRNNNTTTNTTLARRTTTILSRIRSRPQPTFTHPLSHIPTAPDQLVDFDGPADPYRPANWPLHKKVTTTLLYGLVTMSATWASSCYSAGTAQVAAEFGVGSQVAVLGTSLFLVGFGVGPLLWAPLSEVYGRRLAVFVPMFVAACFSFGSAASKDFQTLMLTRFWGAFFASAPVTNTGGVLGDLYGPEARGVAMAGYAMAVVAGPALGTFGFVLFCLW